MIMYVDVVRDVKFGRVLCWKGVECCCDRRLSAFKWSDVAVYTCSMVREEGVSAPSVSASNGRQGYSSLMAQAQCAG
jgi:hypothetical protein